MIIPLIHRVLIKQDRLEDHDETYKRATNSGIVIPKMDEHGREQAAVDVGTVVAIGPTAFKDFGGCSLKVGDRLVYARHGGKQVTDPDTDEKFVMLNDEDCVAILTKTGA